MKLLCRHRKKKTLLKRQQYKGQIPEEIQTYQACHAIFLTVALVIKSYFKLVEICHHLNKVQCIQLVHNHDNENRQCAYNCYSTAIFISILCVLGPQ